jgi:alkanesulfonate monooxygenase SsuD/methylene tetrahydromethanopterin reductase-like flavin-dependent oxidoreductase (luciferase family)
VAAGELDAEDQAVAFIALTALTQAVDEDLPGFEPPAELIAPPPSGAAPWPAALAAHEEVKAIAARLALGLLDAPAARAELASPLAALETALVAADAAVSSQFGVDGPRLTEYRHQINRAAQRLYDE